MSLKPPSDSKKFRAAITPIFAFIFTFSMVGASSIILMIDGWHVNLKAWADSMVFDVMFSFGLAWLISFRNPVSFSADGIYGYSSWGVNRFVSWRDMKAVRPFWFVKLQYLRIYAAADGKVTWLPMFQSQKDEFWQEIRRFAPAESPILNFLK